MMKIPTPIRWMVVAVIIAVAGVVWVVRLGGPGDLQPDSGGGEAAVEAVALAGSASCRECHERFYELWSTSHHGLAMQPFTIELARTQLKAAPTAIAVGQARYEVEFAEDGGYVRERGPDGEKRYPIVHVMGGKNVYYFLTPMERGRLQVLPLAYDVRREEWYDTAASAMRHFQGVRDEAIDWRDPLYTFNTSCHSCHVSQLSKNYDLESDSYHTTWAEPGINCETCHGPSAEHVRHFREKGSAGDGKELKIISTKGFSAEQHNSSCSSCHAKALILTDGFRPGDRFFDHFDLTALESPDFYPDGRDLGENYTYTGWRMNPCANSGQLHCVHCHTSSGRYRFQGEQANNACLPCHEERVKNATAHTRHKGDSAGNRCVGCHMPMTEFARMRRSDHSMRPPMPAATIAYQSPNACNGCHRDRDAAWSDQQVRQWHEEDYQGPVLHRAGLVAAARKGDWSRLPEMLVAITGVDRDEVFATSLIRLLSGCNDERKWPALIQAMQDRSPLVRSAAAMGLAGASSPEAIAALLRGTGDEYRLVRIRAVGALAGLRLAAAGEEDRRNLAAAKAELEASFKARPDDWASHYNLGNYYTDQGRLEEAVACYQMASRLRPDVVHPWVNAAITYARLGNSKGAEQSLVRALELEPGNAVANLNLGLLKAEQGQLREAEHRLRMALKREPRLAQAAYNLAVLVASDRLPEAIGWCRQAYQADPSEPRYAYTLAFYLHRGGNAAQAVELLRELIARFPDYISAYSLLGEIHEGAHAIDRAVEVYRQALSRSAMSEGDRRFFQARIEALLELKGRISGP